MKTTAKPKPAKVKDQEFADNACEVSVFMACFGLVNELKTTYAVLHQGKMSQEVFSHRFNSVLHQLCFTAESTTRFDIMLPVLRYGQFSSFFWRWFNWWDDYLKSLSPVRIMALRLAASGGVADILAKYRPPGDWIAYNSTPPFTAVNT